MHILYLSQYFPPEIGATQTRAYEMAQGLLRAGHDVTMLTEFPNHPQGIIPPAYKGKLYEWDDLDGIEVLRVWVKASPDKSFRPRMWFYLSYMMMATWAGSLLARRRYDLIYATSPPLFVGGAALALSRLRRLPLVFEVRDLWPESAVDLGQLNHARALQLATQLEEACYRRAQKIVVVTEGFKRRLVTRGFAAEKIAVIPNGANTALFQPTPPSSALRQRLGIGPEQFVVAYTGLHGLAHGLETVLETAALLRHQPEILFLLVGNGPRKKALQRQAEAMNLPNVIFHAAVPEQALPDYINLCHVGLDVRRQVGISEMTLPVKMFSYMACAKPVLLSITGEAVEVLNAAEAGLVVPPETPDKLAEAILYLRDHPQQCAAYGRAGHEYVGQHFSRQALAAELVALLEAL